MQMMKPLLFISCILLSLYNQHAVAKLIKNQQFISDGVHRTYDLYLPKQTLKPFSPLVVLLHGHLADADVMTGENHKKAPFKRWLRIAEREGWIIVIPEGAVGSDNKRGWNDCRADNRINPKTNDVKFINSLIDSLTKRYPIDTQRIYAHGSSNGGMMAFRLALESGHKYRAIAAVIAAMPAKTQCKASNTPVSVLIMNGTSDPILPYQGGAVAKKRSPNHERGTVISTPASVRFWLKNNGIKAKPFIKRLTDVDTYDKSKVVKKSFLGGKNHTQVVLYSIINGGHIEPSLSEHYRKIYTFFVGKQNKDIEMVDEVWKFFESTQ